LRHRIPWHDGEESIKYLRNVQQEKGDEALVVFADDGEKFGAWPGTFELVFGDGWLDRFFTLLEENHDWLQTVTPGDYAATHLPLRQVNLPAGFLFRNAGLVEGRLAQLSATLSREPRHAGRSDARAEA
jgi:alpha-amylase